MKRTEKNAQAECPNCGSSEGQMKNGLNRSGTQTCICRFCRKSYTLNPKQHEYDEATRKQAMKLYYSGVSGRGVGKLLSMNKSNVYRWIEKKPSGCG